MANYMVEQTSLYSDEALRKIIRNWREITPIIYYYACKEALKRNIINDGEIDPEYLNQSYFKSSWDEWFYKKDGNRVGPLTSDEIILQILDKELNSDDLIWKSGTQTSSKVSDSEFKIFIHKDARPQISGKKVDNTFIWLLAFAPLIGIMVGKMEIFESANIFWITISLNSILAIIDERKLNAAGYKGDNFIFALLLIPVYLWRRATLLNQSRSYFWTWLVVFFISYFIPIHLQRSQNEEVQTKIEQIESITETASSGYASSVETNTTSENNTIDHKKFKINDGVSLGDWAIGVFKIKDPFIADGIYMHELKKDHKYVVIEVTMLNNSDHPTEYNLYQWKLKDDNNYQYDICVTGVEPDLSTGTLNPGKQIRGWIGFDVLKDSKNFTAIFTPKVFIGDVVEIELY
jgi:hypothetical protein